MTVTDHHFEVLTIGRVGVDIYPLEIGVRLEDVETFGKFLGGSPTNVAVAASRHGRRAAVITRTGEDPFATFVHKALDGFGVDDRYVQAVAGLPTPVTFCEILPPDDFPIWFYRYPKAPDLEIHADELDLDAIRDAKVFWATVTGLSDEPSRTAHHRAFEERDRRSHTILDLDFRASLWDSPTDAQAHIEKVLPAVTLAVGNLEECQAATGATDPDGAADRLLAHGLDLAIIKLGAKGVIGRTQTERVVVPPHPVQVVNGLGAGDAFGGALCHGLLAGWPLETILRFANAAGAIVASRLACSSAMPTTREVETALTDAQGRS